MSENKQKNGVILNAYPDSVKQTLQGMVSVLSLPEFKDVFDTFYILPSLFNTDLDRGFSVIDYGINELLASKNDLQKINELGIDLKLDIILNHASVLSPQFRDLVENGKDSEYADFFINWNEFWKGNGEMTEDGYIQPNDEHISKMFFRKPEMPFLMVRMPDGTDEPYWNTFYQQIEYKPLDENDIIKAFDVQYATAIRLRDIVNTALKEGQKPKDIDFSELSYYKEKIVDFVESRRTYLGQMDLNIKSEKVWAFYDETLKMLSGYGAKIVRLDAFAYSSKEVGKPNFLNNPETWEILDRVRSIADGYSITLLPEIHSTYQEKIHETLTEKGYATYDFFLPGLIIDAIENKTTDYLVRWAKELVEKNMNPVNMLGCHDGIPLLDLKGLLDEKRIKNLIDIIVSRGGYVKNLHGQTNMYYQVNATYFSALGEDEQKMLLARVIQLFMPGKPQVWYLDLFGGKNDHAAVERSGVGGHKEINRTNLTDEDVQSALKTTLVQKQLELLRFRNTHKAFLHGATFEASTNGTSFQFSWKHEGNFAILKADVSNCSFSIESS